MTLLPPSSSLGKVSVRYHCCLSTVQRKIILSHTSWYFRLTRFFPTFKNWSWPNKSCCLFLTLNTVIRRERKGMCRVKKIKSMYNLFLWFTYRTVRTSTQSQVRGSTHRPLTDWNVLLWIGRNGSRVDSWTILNCQRFLKIRCLRTKLISEWQIYLFLFHCLRFTKIHVDTFSLPFLGLSDSTCIPIRFLWEPKDPSSQHLVVWCPSIEWSPTTPPLLPLNNELVRHQRQPNYFFHLYHHY